MYMDDLYHRICFIRNNNKLFTHSLTYLVTLQYTFIKLTRLLFILQLILFKTKKI